MERFIDASSPSSKALVAPTDDEGSPRTPATPAAACRGSRTVRRSDGSSSSSSSSSSRGRCIRGGGVALKCGASALALSALVLLAAEPKKALLDVLNSGQLSGLWGYWTPYGERIQTSCSETWDNCIDTRCCKDPSQRCFEKDEFWANCNNTCTPGINLGDPVDFRTPWTCKDLTCGSKHDNCKNSGCCQDPGQTCYEKNDHWWNCNETCTPGINPMDPPEHQTPWSCKVRGPTAGDALPPHSEQACSVHGPASNPFSTTCLSLDPRITAPYEPSKQVWTCDCESGCNGADPNSCTECGTLGDKPCFWALTWYCCPPGASGEY